MRKAGDLIEKYELVLPLAQGGMGSVWAAKIHRTHGFEKIVAIKTVLPELATDPGARAMFLDEARLASAIDHRNVARVLDFLEHEGALYLVMEWVDGISLMALHERMLAEQGARIPIGIALRILADVCSGLHAAHELRYTNGEPCNLVHRDVCPHNVLVATEGSAKLIDFGVAKTRFRVAPDSTLGELRGRIDFMAPEQAQSDPLDRRADIWSVGAMLYYLLAGHGPFGVRERNDTLRRLLKGMPPLPPPTHAHPAVKAVLTGCLARRREDRFSTAAHLACAIEEAIEDMGVAATARDVAEFLADRSVHADPRLATTGRCAIPTELTLLRPDTVSTVQPTRRRAVRRSSSVRRSVLALACVSAIGLVAAGASTLHRPAPLPPTAAAPSLVDDVPTAPRLEKRVEPRIEKEVERVEEAIGPHPKAPPGHKGRWKQRSHERFHATP
jgi:serine/threonine-protein kinase